MNIDCTSPEPPRGLPSEVNKFVDPGQAHPQGEK
jgi:hypothetical protein